MKTRQRLRKSIILLSFFLFPVTYYYFSPYLIIDATIKGIVNGSFIIFSLLLMSALIFGRIFCGWACPAAGCQEALFSARNKRIKSGNFIKWVIWTPWIITIVALAIKEKGYRKVDFFYQTAYGISVNDVHALITYLIVLFLIVIPALVFGRRSFCHHICWMAPFMILGREIRNIFGWPSLKLAAESKKCIHCGTCTSNCPMSLPVEQMIEHGLLENRECILCGTCIDGCKDKVIKYDFKRN